MDEALRDWLGRSATEDPKPEEETPAARWKAMRQKSSLPAVTSKVDQDKPRSDREAEYMASWRNSKKK